MILLIFAAILMMWKIDRGSERTRYPHTIEFTITKNLHDINENMHINVSRPYIDHLKFSKQASNFT